MPKEKADTASYYSTLSVSTLLNTNGGYQWDLEREMPIKVITAASLRLSWASQPLSLQKRTKNTFRTNGGNQEC